MNNLEETLCNKLRDNYDCRYLKIINGRLTYQGINLRLSYESIEEITQNTNQKYTYTFYNICHHIDEKIYYARYLGDLDDTTSVFYNTPKEPIIDDYEFIYFKDGKELYREQTDISKKNADVFINNNEIVAIFPPQDYSLKISKIQFYIPKHCLINLFDDTALYQRAWYLLNRPFKYQSQIKISYHKYTLELSDTILRVPAYILQIFESIFINDMMEIFNDTIYLPNIDEETFDRICTMIIYSIDIDLLSDENKKLIQALDYLQSRHYDTIIEKFLKNDAIKVYQKRFLIS
jgi:hypothetical protein